MLKKNSKEHEKTETQVDATASRQDASVVKDEERYLIEGKLSTGLWRFAVPYMIAYLLQALYGAVDLLIVGQFCDQTAIAAVGVGAQILHSALGLILGLSAGATVLIGYNVGAKDSRGVAHALGSTAFLFAVLALVITPLAACLTNTIVSLMQTPEEAVAHTRDYVFVCACGAPFIIGYNVLGAIYRGFGDSKTPTYFVAIACVINVIGDLALVAGCRMGPLGAALATILAQAASFLWALYYMRRKRFSFEFHRGDLIPRRHDLKEIVKVGAPMALQDVLTSLSFLVIQAIINLMGVSAAAGMGVVERIIGFMFIPPVAFSLAVATASAQNFGARQPQRALRAVGLGVCFSMVFAVCFLVLCQTYPEKTAQIFAKDLNVIDQAAQYLRSFSLDLLCVCLVFNINGFFIGSGRALVVMTHSSLAAILARIPLSYLFSQGPKASMRQVGYAAPLASVFSIIFCVIYLLWLHAHGKLGVATLTDDEHNPNANPQPQMERETV